MVTKFKMLKAPIHKCNICLFQVRNKCYKMNEKKIQDLDTIPEWCPLEDYP